MARALRQQPVDEARQRGAARRLPIGAELLPDARGAHFRVWAPRRAKVEVVFYPSGEAIALEPDGAGYFAGAAPHARAGARYRFRLDGADELYPDPASRYQPEGPHGPSEIVDPAAFAWTDHDWPGASPAGQVLYELHIGTFTKAGTWAAAAERLADLKDLGVTCLEVMPVNEFAGRWGWGYDGVDLFAPYHHYGAPDEMRRFIDRAHALGIGAILDVVYNHLGPAGNYLPQFSETYFSRKHKTDWGEALNFDGEGSGGVREFFLANAQHWIEEYHLDGFRFDATDAIRDDSPDEHILAAIAQRARQSAGKRRVYLVNENEAQNTRMVRPRETGGYGMDALWNDDFHHSALVAISGHNEAYLTDHLGGPQEFVSAAKWGYLYQGQFYSWQKKRRGTPALDLPPTAFVNFIENHDQLANLARGLRTHQLTSRGHYKAMVALLLLMPQTPMLFQGQEFAASSPFQYFADHDQELNRLIRKGRAEFLSQFPSVARPEMQAHLPDPGDPRTFQRCKLDWDERDEPFHAEVLAMYKDLLRLRREDPIFSRMQSRPRAVDGATLGPLAFVLRYFGDAAEDRLLVVNFGVDRHMSRAPEPLLAPPLGKRWEVLWSSEDPRYLGNGTLPLENENEPWRIPGRSAVVLRPADAKHLSGTPTEQPIPTGAAPPPPPPPKE